MKAKNLLSIAVVSALLVACGGGGSNESSQGAVQPNPPHGNVDVGNNTGADTGVSEKQEIIPVVDHAQEDKYLACAIKPNASISGYGDVEPLAANFERFIGLRSGSYKLPNTGEFGILGKDVYAFDAYIGKSSSGNEWISSVPEDILSMRVSTSLTGDAQVIKYQNFLNTAFGTPSDRVSDKTLVHMTYDPCHGYAEQSHNGRFLTSKMVKLGERFDPGTNQLLVSYQAENTQNSPQNSPKYFVVYDVIDVSGKIMSDYVPKSILEMARYAVSRFSLYAEIERFPSGSVILKTNSILVPEHFYGFKMDQVKYFSETFSTTNDYQDFVTSISRNILSAVGDYGLTGFDLSYSSNLNAGKYLQVFDTDRSQSVFNQGGTLHSATHQPLMIYKPDFDVDTTEYSRSYYNAVAGKALHDLMNTHIYDDR